MNLGAIPIFLAQTYIGLVSGQVEVVALAKQWSLPRWSFLRRRWSPRRGHGTCHCTSCPTQPPPSIQTNVGQCPTGGEQDILARRLLCIQVSSRSSTTTTNADDKSLKVCKPSFQPGALCLKSSRSRSILQSFSIRAENQPNCDPTINTTAGIYRNVEFEGKAKH